MPYEEPPKHWPVELVEADRMVQALAEFCERNGLTLAVCAFPTKTMYEAEQAAKGGGMGACPRSIMMGGRVDVAVNDLMKKAAFEIAKTRRN